MKILISGGTGFIGKHLVKHLLDANNEVHLIVRSGITRENFDARLKIFTFSGNLEDLVSFMKKEKFDGVVHLASLFLVNHEPADILGLITSNVLFGTQLIDAATKANIPWFINTGTFAQHYKNKRYSPVNLYAATKQAFEDVAQFYIETTKTTFVTIKLFDTFGEGDTRPKIFNLWSKISISGEQLTMSPGKQIIDINYIDNVTDGYLHMISLLNQKGSSKFHGKAFIISSQRRMTLRKLATLFEKVTQKKLNIVWGGRPYRERDVMVPWEKGQPLPGWKPKISLEEAIKRTISKLQ